MKISIIGILFLCINFNQGFSIEFRFDQPVGRKYRIKNLISQKIYRNEVYVKSVDAMNKATFEIVDRLSNISVYQGQYSYYEKNVDLNEAYKMSQLYETEFYKDDYGRIEVKEGFIMPSIRSVPTFPTNEVSPGDSWTFEGAEMHEGIFNKNNGFYFEMPVEYRFVGNEILNGKEVAKILINYFVNYFPERHPEIIGFSGFSHTTYYWDLQKKAPYFYYEDYAFSFQFVNGETARYKGYSEGIVEDIQDLPIADKKELQNELQDAVGVNKGIDIKSDDEGIILNLQNILFDFNRANLKNEALKSLSNISAILRNRPDLDIVVTGHTDNIGDSKYNYSLSEKRAKSAADFLIKNGVSLPRISYRGLGSDFPIDDNNSEKGRANNRRVEIKILTQE